MKILREFLTGNTGQLSSKRLMGCFCIVNAVAMGYAGLNDAAEVFLMAGVALIGGGVAELWAPKKEVKDDTKL